jgi:hypothetical protein
LPVNNVSMVVDRTMSQYVLTFEEVMILFFSSLE